VAGGWWLVAGGWWLVAGGWWLVAGGWVAVDVESIRVAGRTVVSSAGRLSVAGFRIRAPSQLRRIRRLQLSSVTRGTTVATLGRRPPRRDSDPERRYGCLGAEVWVEDGARPRRG
jgi:hypothetical protein